MKKVASILAAVMLSLTCATAVNADDFYNSATQGGTTIAVDGPITTANGATVTVTASQTKKTEMLRSLYVEAGSVEDFLSDDLALNSKEIREELLSKGVNLAQLSCMDIVDISIEEGSLAEGDSVDIPVKVQGIAKGEAVYALHFMADGSMEIIPAVATDKDTVTVTMTSFSPVMIMRYTGETAPTNDGNVTSATAEKTPTGVYSNVALWAGVLVVAVAAAGIVLYDRKKKAN